MHIATEREEIKAEATKKIRSLHSSMSRTRTYVMKNLRSIQEDLKELEFYQQTLEHLNKAQFSRTLADIRRKPASIALKEARELSLVHRRSVIDKLFLQALGILPKSLKKNAKKRKQTSSIMKLASIQAQLNHLKECGMEAQEKEIVLAMVEQLKGSLKN